MKIPVAALSKQEAYRLITGAVVPRPIAWVSTRAADGSCNLAPFSYFMALTESPPTIAVSIGRRRGDKKDSLRNIEASGEFVVNVVAEELAEAMNRCSGEYAPEVDEFEVAGLTPAPCDLVDAPRVAQSPINMECRLVQTVPIGSPQVATLVIGEVVQFHVRDDLYREGMIDQQRLRAIGRLAGNEYTRQGELFSMVRPKAGPEGEVLKG